MGLSGGWNFDLPAGMCACCDSGSGGSAFPEGCDSGGGGWNDVWRSGGIVFVIYEFGVDKSFEYSKILSAIFF